MNKPCDVHNTIELNSLDKMNDDNQVIEIEPKSFFTTNSLTYYHSFTKFGILFIRIGNTYCFNFDFNQEPKYIIGGNYSRGLFMFTFYFVISIAFVILLWFTFPLFIIPYLGLIVLAFLCFSQTYLLNPGIILKNALSNNDQSMTYCEICKIYILKAFKSHHCKACDICVSGYDHHCGVIDKCIGKNNKKWFIAMVFSASVLYLVTILGIIFYFSYIIFNLKAPTLL